MVDGNPRRPEPGRPGRDVALALGRVAQSRGGEQIPEVRRPRRGVEIARHDDRGIGVLDDLGDVVELVVATAGVAGLARRRRRGMNADDVERPALDCKLGHEVRPRAARRLPYLLEDDRPATEQNDARARPPCLLSVVRVQVPQLPQYLPPVSPSGVDQQHQIRIGGAHELEHLLGRAVVRQHVRAHQTQGNAARRSARRAAQPQVLEHRAVHERDGEDGGAAIRPSRQGNDQ